MAEFNSVKYNEVQIKEEEISENDDGVEGDPDLKFDDEEEEVYIKKEEIDLMEEAEYDEMEKQCRHIGKNKSIQQMTSVKTADKSTTKRRRKRKRGKTPKDGQTSNIQNETVFSADNIAKHNDETERRKQRDLKMLYVGRLPEDVTSDELKALSPDVVNVELPCAGKIKGKLVYAFLQFDSEETAEANYEPLQSKTIRGQLLNIDYRGVKSKNRKTEENKKVLYHGRRLFISGLPLDVKVAKIAESFPNAFQVSINTSSVFRTATICFLTNKATNEAFNATKEIEVDGHKLPVLHVVIPKNRKPKGRKRPKNSAALECPMNKKFKVEKNSEE